VRVTAPAERIGRGGWPAAWADDGNWLAARPLARGTAPRHHRRRAASTPIGTRGARCRRAPARPPRVRRGL